MEEVFVRIKVAFLESDGSTDDHDYFNDDHDYFNDDHDYFNPDHDIKILYSDYLSDVRWPPQDRSCCKPRLRTIV